MADTTAKGATEVKDFLTENGGTVVQGDAGKTAIQFDKTIKKTLDAE